LNRGPFQILILIFRAGGAGLRWLGVAAAIGWLAVAALVIQLRRSPDLRGN
jgi:hypothetical protein